MNSAPTQTNILTSPPSNSPHYWGAGGASSTRRQRGQTIVIALLVLLLLAFVGGLFATIVTRNLVNAGRSNRVQSADYYAEAGTRFANDQLTASLDGADWRPPLQYALDPAFQPKDKYGSLRYAALTLPTVSPNDPDADYLKQGFTRYNIGGGRYLLRVTYDPVGLNSQDNSSATANTAYSDPRARYIKIESVGREGTVDPTDPTTYTNAPKTQLNATLVQYKAIGITDYARFETNPENRSDIMALGVSSNQDAKGNIVTPGVFDFNTSTTTPTLPQYPITTTYGATDAFLTSGGILTPNPNAGSGQAAPASYTLTPGGGSIHVNGSVRFFGQNNIYLNNNASNNGSFGDTVEVAGNLLLDNYKPAAASSTTPLSQDQDASVMTNITASTAEKADDAALANDPNYVYPSNDPNFYTHSGAIRDGSGGNAPGGNPRSVNRLEPPTLDTVNPVTNLTRYASISKNATSRSTENTATNATPTQYATSAAAYGYGQYVYVDNTDDVQRESSSLVGGYTLIDEWLHRAGANDVGSKSGWVANFYRPPGVDIVLGRQETTLNGTSTTAGTPTSFYGVRMTRSDVDGSGSIIGWKNPDGTPISGVNTDGNTQSTMTVSYKSLNASNDPTAAVPATGTQAYTAYSANPNNDVVIYAEGNVRVHGVVSADPTDLNAPTTYAGTTGGTTDDDHLPRHVTIVTNGTAYIDGNLLRGNPQSSITVLAHDYVCVNTTQFLAGPIVDQNPSGTNPPGAFTGDPTLRGLDLSASDEELIQEFNFGLPNSGTPGGYPVTSNAATPSKLALYVSGGPSSAGQASADFDLVDPRTGNDLNGNTPFTSDNSLAQDPVGSLGTGGAPILRTTFDLTSSAGSILSAVQSQVFQLRVRRTQVYYDPGTGVIDPNFTQDFLLERAAILPMDIRIEAVLFAQTRSFFVIPGDWFNSNSTDNVQAFATTVKSANGRLSRPGIDTDDDRQGRFPFFGQPIDMKITIDGSVSEARPADITAQSAWMAKWGWIPQFHGSLIGVPTDAPTLETSGHPATAKDATGNLIVQPGVGLQIVYNPLAGFPYYTDHYLRTDLFGRPLPYAPKLPVCAGTLYAGQNTGESILQ